MDHQFVWRHVRGRVTEVESRRTRGAVVETELREGEGMEQEDGRLGAANSTYRSSSLAALLRCCVLSAS
jgi:hypothetical protein